MTANNGLKSRQTHAATVSVLVSIASMAFSVSGTAEVAAQTMPVATAPAAMEARPDLIVNFDQSTLLQLSRPADLVIVGNPSIADVAIQSGTLLVVTGKAFGITNIIVLDAERKVIQDQRLLVRRDNEKVVNLTRGKDRQTYNCTSGQCNPTMTVGDDPAYFAAVKESMSGKASTSDKSGDPGASNN
jgi:hypothetical protein